MEAMTESLRTQFQPQVDEFISNLHTFATGSYLKEDEKEFWDAPFDAAVLPELKSLIESIISDIEHLGSQPEGTELNGVLTESYNSLEAFNAKHADAVVEPEEKEELAELFTEVAKAAGASEEDLAQLPEFE